MVDKDYYRPDPWYFGAGVPAIDKPAEVRSKMASKDIISSLKVPIQALSEKYGVSKGKIEKILEQLPNSQLGRLDWKDLDAVVQEGIIDEKLTGEQRWRELRHSTDMDIDSREET